jgi:putative thioredoxin
MRKPTVALEIVTMTKASDAARRITQTSTPKETTTATFRADVLTASQQKPVLVDFWAPWCGPCKQLSPALEKAIADSGGKVTLVKMNIDEHPQMASQLGIQSIPAVIAFDKGQPVDRFVGALPESAIRTFIEGVVRPLGSRSSSLEGAAVDDYGLTKKQLAETAGLAPESLYKRERLSAPKTQTRLREMSEILTRVSAWAGGRAQAMAWYRAEPIPAFGGRTAESLVKSGQAGQLRDYLDSIAIGGFA